MRQHRNGVRSMVLVLALGTTAVALAATTETKPATAAAPAVKVLGAPITSQNALPLATVVGDPDAYAGKTVVVDAQVRRSCEALGCWMELAPTADKGTQGCRVTFKNEGFVVPLNAAGSTARVEGVVDVRNVPAEEVAHMEAEGAVFAHKAADGSAREVHITATGVELRRK